jgi:hypothetical protein
MGLEHIAPELKAEFARRREEAMASLQATYVAEG